MNEFKTLETLKKYKSLIETTEPEKITSDDKFFVFNIELELAKSILYDFGDKSTNKLAKILSSVTVADSSYIEPYRTSSDYCSAIDNWEPC